VNLPDSLVKRLEQRRYRFNPRKVSEQVFPKADGGLYLPDHFPRSHFKSLLERAGLPTSIRVYDLRHTCATLLLQAEVHPKVVSERLGHASITLTLDTYTHVLPTMQRAATEKLDALINGDADEEDEADCGEEEDR
jgi:integrase